MSRDETRTSSIASCSTEQQKQLEVGRQLNFSHGVPGLARLRVKVYFQRGSLAAAFRRVDGARRDGGRGQPREAAPHFKLLELVE